jgi:fructose-specific phosphotransferase system IIC component
MMQTSRDMTLVAFFAVLLALTIVLVYLGPLSGQPWAQIMQWLQVILPVETVLLGSTVGFYFGNRR